MMISLMRFLLLFLALLSFTSSEEYEESRPHIVFILIDDLGWNDVSFHGMTQIPTPNIDALAFSGLALQRYYVLPICTPSRAALMTGKHPIHTGMQHTVLFGGEPRGLPLEEKLLPEYLRDLGYTTRIVGKWHLGCWKKDYTPTYRGFQSHFGYWTGHQDYYDHTAVETGWWGLDIRRNMDVAYDAHGKYSTNLFTDEAVKIIENHSRFNKSSPLFLYMAHVAVHSGNPYNPLPAPDPTVAKFTNITNFNRRKFAAIMTKLDESVGRVVQSLQKARMLNDTIIIFSSDNGGAAAGFNINAASNWPLRGVKNTLWEGGVKGAGLLWSSRIAKRQRVAQQLIHISDWLPTLYSAAGGNVTDLGDIDGVDMWSALSENTPSNRTEVLHNIDDIYGNAAISIGDWKFIKGTTYGGTWDGWYGPAGHDDPYEVSLVRNSMAGKALAAIGYGVDTDRVLQMLNETEINCLAPQHKVITACKPTQAPCLFNVKEDPCEQNNLAKKYPTILEYLRKRLIEYNETAVPPGNRPVDPRGNPKNWNYVWTNFGDYQ